MEDEVNEVSQPTKRKCVFQAETVACTKIPREGKQWEKGAGGGSGRCSALEPIPATQEQLVELRQIPKGSSQQQAKT